jgi:hypothetical protein
MPKSIIALIGSRLLLGFDDNDAFLHDAGELNRVVSHGGADDRLDHFHDHEILRAGVTETSDSTVESNLFTALETPGRLRCPTESSTANRRPFSPRRQFLEEKSPPSYHASVGVEEGHNITVARQATATRWAWGTTPIRSLRLVGANPPKEFDAKPNCKQDL